MKRIFAITFIILQSLFACISFAGDSTSFNPVPIPVAAKGGIPVGTIIPWASTGYPEDYDSARTNWMDCDGRSFSKATHEELGKLYPSGRIPNLHNQFMRGGTVAQVGQVVADSTRSHAHNIPAHSHTVSGTASAQTVTVGSQSVSGTADAQAYTDAWTEIGYGGFPLWTGNEINVGQRVGIASRYTSGGSISGSTSGGTYSTGGGAITGWTNTVAQSSDATGGAETAPQHIRVRYLIRVLP